MEKKEGGTKSRTGTYGNGLALGSLSYAAKKKVLLPIPIHTYSLRFGTIPCFALGAQITPSLYFFIFYFRILASAEP